MNENKTSEVKRVFLCVGVTARKQLLSYKTFVVFAVVLMFHWYTFGNLPKVCEYLKFAVSPWVFPFFWGNPTMFFVAGGMALLLHCDAPYTDGQTPLFVVRMGKKAWIVSQILYLLLSSLVYVLFHVAASVVVLMPYVGYSDKWGAVLEGLSRNIRIYESAGTKIGVYPYAELMENFTPFEAMGWSMLLLWLGTVFLGMIILFLRIMTRKMSGIAVGGFLTALAYFTAYQGQALVGPILYFISPVSWINLAYINWGNAENCPSTAYVLLCYAALIAVITFLSVKMFCAKDMEWEDI